MSVKKDVEYIEDYFSVVRPSKGGTIKEFAEFIYHLGNPIFRSTSIDQVWVPGNRWELQRFPLECNEDVDKETLNNILRERKIWVANYLVNPSDRNKPNCFNYICEDSNYHIDHLSSASSRRNIRRGLRNFKIRLCSWEELVLNGFKAYTETALRHGYRAPDENEFRKMVKEKLNSPFYDIWGAWEGQNLMAWMTIIKIDNWAMIDVARSCKEAQNKSPNYALIYTVTKYLMNEEKRKYITYGLSSIEVDVNEISMHEYKLRVGYMAIPMCRKFAVQSLINPFVYKKISSWTLEKIAHILPQYAKLRKLAGLSRILSGREIDSLNWVNKH